MIYNANGRRRRVECPCPKCRHPLSEVFMVTSEDGGEIVRQRRCPECQAKWFTCQEPEYIIRRDEIKWRGKKPALRQTAPAAGGRS